MPCCAAAEKDANKGLGMIADKDRKCTDLVCLIVFGVFLCGLIGVSIAAALNGQPARFVYGTDYLGNVCGDSNANLQGVDEANVMDRSEEPYTVYPRTVEDFILNAAKTDPTEYEFYGICVDKCPKQGDVVCNDDGPSGVSDSVKRECIWAPVTGYNNSAVDCKKIRTNCWVIGQDQTPVSFRCVPKYEIEVDSTENCTYPSYEDIGMVLSADDPACLVKETKTESDTSAPPQPNLLFEQLNSAQAIWGGYFTDLNRAAWVILVCSLVIGLILGFIWLFLLQKFTGCMVWTTVVIVCLLMIGLTIYTYWLGGAIDPPSVASLSESQTSSGSSSFTPSTGSDEQQQKIYLYLAYVMTVLTIITLGLAIYLRPQLQTAIRVIEMAAEAVATSWDLYLLPIFSLLALCVVALWFIYVAAALASWGSVTELSSSDVEGDAEAGSEEIASDGGDTNSQLYAEAVASANTTTFSEFQVNDNIRYLLAYHFFGALWINQFIQGMSMTVVAIVTAGWYFSQNADAVKAIDKPVYEKPALALLNAAKLTFWYHAGSVAMGSFLIALIQFIRAVLAYIHKQIKDRGGDNALIKWLMCCLQSCLRCVEWLVKVISRNAYIFIALKGYSYCTAAMSAVTFILSNIVLFAVLNTVTSVFFLLGKVTIAGTAAFAAYGLLTNLDTFQENGATPISSAWLPALVTLLLGYAVAHAFFGILDMAIDTILISFTVDKEETKAKTGTAKAAHAGEGNFISKTVDGIEEEHGHKYKKKGKHSGGGDGAGAAGGKVA